LCIITYNTLKIPDGKYQISILITNYENEFGNKKGDSQILANNTLSFDINFEVLGQHGWSNFTVENLDLWVKSQLANFGSELANVDASSGINFEIFERHEWAIMNLVHPFLFDKK